LLGWFTQLSRGRVIHEFGGFGAIPWMEIDAWARLMRIRPKAWEIDALLRLDRVWMSVMAEKGHSFEDADDGSPPATETKQIGTDISRRRLR
jgi:hypothetical protein